MMNRLRVGMVLWVLACSSARAGGFDHEIAFDQSGIWARKYQTGLIN